MLTVDKAVVLIVEGDPLLRLAAVDIVKDAGLAVVEAASARAAVRILERRSDVQIVFTDIDLPGDMDGESLAAFIRDRWPLILIICTSGQTTIDTVKLPANTLFFSKPYKKADLIAAFRQFDARTFV